MQKQEIQPVANAIDEDVVDRLQAASVLKIFAMSPGDEVDVLWGGIFWKARVTRVDAKGFNYEYENSEEERGYRSYSSLHYKWRFPLSEHSEHYTFENMLAMRQVKKRKCSGA